MERLLQRNQNMQEDGFYFNEYERNYLKLLMN